MEKRTQKLEEMLFDLMQHESSCENYRDKNAYKCFGACVVDINAELVANFIEEKLDAWGDEYRAHIMNNVLEI